MPNYKNGKIYKLSYDNLTYYGSTTQTLKKRLSYHKTNYNRWKAESANKCTSYLLFDKYGSDNFTIELVENYACDTKQELLMREQFYLDNFDCVNENAAYINAEGIRQRNKQWYEDNKATISEQKKHYRQDNIEAITEKKKQKIVCECGKTCSNSHIARHRKSAFHLAYIKNLLTI